MHRQQIKNYFVRGQLRRTVIQRWYTVLAEDDQTVLYDTVFGKKKLVCYRSLQRQTSFRKRKHIHTLDIPDEANTTHPSFDLPLIAFSLP